MVGPHSVSFASALQELGTLRGRYSFILFSRVSWSVWDAFKLAFALKRAAVVGGAGVLVAIWGGSWYLA